jgi:hypothetical protein
MSISIIEREIHGQVCEESESLRFLRKTVESFVPQPGEVDRGLAIRNTRQWQGFLGAKKEYDRILSLAVYVSAEDASHEIYKAAERFLDALALPFPEGAISRIEEILRRFLVDPIDEKTSGGEAFSVYDINPSLIRGNELPPNPRTSKDEEKLQEIWAEDLRNMSPEEIAGLVVARYVVGKTIPFFFRRIAEARGAKLYWGREDIGGVYWYGFDGMGEDLVDVVKNPDRFFFGRGCRDNTTLEEKLAYLLTSRPWRVNAGATPKDDERIFLSKKK